MTTPMVRTERGIALGWHDPVVHLHGVEGGGQGDHVDSEGGQRAFRKYPPPFANRVDEPLTCRASLDIGAPIGGEATVVSLRKDRIIRPQDQGLPLQSHRTGNLMMFSVDIGATECSR